ncbi:MAG: DUF3795 domain-containing protein [Syntrophotalea acetylenica]|uniref:DUF3795 domain-containing protein n=1 Tax=Syntrophotalea acetylenica TaxID=29542 RepID=A0A1L3GHL5_SYNAC|nr:hypothetical protein A7E75_09100 [Syntrophotalea acetylenica]APG43228.1 hypothetical protein A6070_03075 [Syntrophotalea acetylenica]MDD4457823.1 DUF3795 domain-containing protein [Syntrophotalea acetylenica]
MLAYCGKDCEQCEAYAPLVEDASFCSGCRSEGPGCNILGRNCAIRLCARTNRQAICATCSVFPCAKLKELFLLHPDAETQLNRLSGISCR